MKKLFQVILSLTISLNFVGSPLFAQTISVKAGEGARPASLRASAKVNKVSSLLGEDLTDVLMTVSDNEVELTKENRRARAVLLKRKIVGKKVELLACWRDGELLDNILGKDKNKTAVVTTDDGVRHRGELTQLGSESISIVGENGKEEHIRCSTIVKVNSELAVLIRGTLTNVDNPPANFGSSWSGQLTSVVLKSCYDRQSFEGTTKRSKILSSGGNRISDMPPARKFALAVVGLTIVACAIAIPLAVAIPLANRKNNNPGFNPFLLQLPQQPLQPQQQQRQQNQQN